jgi:hypothetical protein
MTLHKALFENIPPASKLMKQYGPFIRSAHEADGYYYLVQEIAGKYGPKAYKLAEQVFREMGMSYDRKKLETPGGVRRVGYAFDGINVYDIEIRRFRPEMSEDVVWLYNREIRSVSDKLFLDKETLLKKIVGSMQPEKQGLFIAYNKASQRLGFVHCCIHPEMPRTGSVEALFYLPGQIHAHVGERLIKTARTFFKAYGIRKVYILSGAIPYPFYRTSPDTLIKGFRSKLNHIYRQLQAIKT